MITIVLFIYHIKHTFLLDNAVCLVHDPIVYLSVHASNRVDSGKLNIVL